MGNKQNNTTDKSTSLPVIDPKELLADEELLCCVGGIDIGIIIITLPAKFDIKIPDLEV